MRTKLKARTLVKLNQFDLLCLASCGLLLRKDSYEKVSDNLCRPTVEV